MQDWVHSIVEHFEGTFFTLFFWEYRKENRQEGSRMSLVERSIPPLVPPAGRREEQRWKPGERRSRGGEEEGSSVVR